MSITNFTISKKKPSHRATKRCRWKLENSNFSSGVHLELIINVTHHPPQLRCISLDYVDEFKCDVYGFPIFTPLTLAMVSNMRNLRAIQSGQQKYTTSA